MRVIGTLSAISRTARCSISGEAHASAETSTTYVPHRRRRATPASVRRSCIAIPPPHCRQFPLPRPHLIERVRVIKATVLHDVPNGVRVSDVLEGIRVEYLQVSQLSGFDRTELLAQPNRVGAEPRPDAKHVMTRHAAQRHGPEVEVRAQSGNVTVTSHADAT